MRSSLDSFSTFSDELKHANKQFVNLKKDVFDGVNRKIDEFS